ncbi:MAG: sigma-54-dependent Fis family transcriptional regulator [Acidobacteria bacterium]|nr:sigma-54-dependent Fis family transcriptional regulator [Acidobacteriota bacterium]
MRTDFGGALAVVDPDDAVTPMSALPRDPCQFDDIISASSAMRPVLELARTVSDSASPVLILGETGTGKEMLARAIHANGRRRTRSFVPVNCAALPPDLMESELYGHRRGAFSGALTDHCGLFTFAHRGTLLLDEIGELPAGAQAKLLRVLQSGEIRPVGGVESRTVDVRILVATNRSLAELQHGVLRQDLFYRLSVVIIEIPPLRERRDDVVPLFEHFLARYRRPGAASLWHVEPEALDLLLKHPFPGNVRELENLAQFLCTVLPPHAETVRAQDVLGWLRRRAAHGTVGGAAAPDSLNLQALEEWAVRTALDRAGGNKSYAAAMLGVSRDTLYRKILELKDRHGTGQASGPRGLEQ